MLDLGCGSGVLAIAAARSLPHVRIVASDIDPRSAEIARENIHLNGAAPRVQVVCAAGLAHPLLRRARFDLVVANILAGPLIALKHDITNAVGPGGTLVLSGLLTSQAREVLAHYHAVGCASIAHDSTAGWSTLTLAPRHRTRCGPGRVVYSR
jgi:ribosomal protein L11 methyltransferase